MNSYSEREMRKLRAKCKSIWQSSFMGWNGISGVYVVCTELFNIETLKKEPLKVWYVGSSKDIGKRLNNSRHPYCVLWSKGYHPFIRYIETPEYKKLEKRMIRLLDPPMNTQYRKLEVIKPKDLVKGKYF